MMNKFKKWLALGLSALMLTGTMSAFAGCGDEGGGSAGGDESFTEEIDTDKTQLYVRNYKGGFGNKWLYTAKDKLEAQYAGQSLEPGKTGVQVMIEDIKEAPDVSGIPNDIYDVYFAEALNYLQLVKQGVVEDITDVVTGTNPLETSKTIESKMTAEQQAYFGYPEADGAHYYGIPHYVTSLGFIYDIDRFNEKGYYFAKGYENETELANKFIVDDSDKKSAGPDGTEGTDDDGLPATYEDFFDLCQFILDSGDTPINWGAKSARYYQGTLLYQLMADYQGKDTFMKNATFNGTMDELVKFDENGEIVYKSDGSIATESVTLDPTWTADQKGNGYETYRHISFYYALDFVHRLVDNTSKYGVAGKTDNSTYTAFDAQDDYVLSRHIGKRQVMLLDGTWWDSESTGAFEEAITYYGDKAKKENCNYGWLPLPKATREQVAKKVKPTLLNGADSLCFIKTGLPDWKKELAKNFLRILHTDEALVDFTVKTNAFKNLQYEVPDSVVATLSPFGKMLHENLQKYDVVNIYHANEQYYNTTYLIAISRRFSLSPTEFPTDVFQTQDMSTAEYFKKVNQYVRSSVWPGAPAL